MSSNHSNMSHGNGDAAEAKGAVTWLLGAGGFAVGLSIFLATVDYKLSHSDREKVLGKTINELRVAQSTLPSRATDRRQGNGLAGFVGGEPAVSAHAAAAEHTEHHD